MLARSDEQFNNNAYVYVIRNVTINTGVGNPNASGLTFYGSNAAEISNVPIRDQPT